VVLFSLPACRVRSQLFFRHLGVTFLARVDLEFDPIKSPSANAKAASVLYNLSPGIAGPKEKRNPITFFE
jgi:hypothetical protein